MMLHGSVLVRAVSPDDEAAWTILYEGYRRFYRLAPDPAVVARVWSWLLDPDHEVRGLVVVSDGGPVGLAHYRRFARPSSGTTGLYLDDLFVRPQDRAAGAGRLLLGTLSELAEREGRSVVRWITAEDNATARRLYDAVASATPWVTYDLVPGSLQDPRLSAPAARSTRPSDPGTPAASRPAA